MSEGTSSFEGQDYYKVLGLDKSCSQKDITKAYRRLALKYHPDRNDGNKQATVDFQHLSRVYETLSNPSKRERYDKYGEDEETSEDFDNAYAYYKNLFQEVTLEDIEEYRKHYKNSADERTDLFDAYKQFKGNMVKVFEWVPLSDQTDVPRFCTMIDEAIQKKELKSYKAYNKTKTDPSLGMQDMSEAKEAEELATTLGLKKSDTSSEDGLAQLIRAKQSARNSTLDGMLAKYEAIENCKPKNKKTPGKKKTKSKRKKDEMPSEEEFQRIQKQMMSK